MLEQQEADEEREKTIDKEFDIFIVGLTKTFICWARQWLTIYEVKAQIVSWVIKHNNWGDTPLAVEDIILCLEGVPMEDNDFIETYKVVPEASLRASIRLRGGAPPKKKRVCLQDLSVRADDHQLVRDCFGFTFSLPRFLSSLHRDKLVEYQSKVEARSMTQINELTIDFEPSYTALKDRVNNEIKINT
jgi:hypothetical protein